MAVGASFYHTPESVPQSNNYPPPLSNDRVGDDADFTTRLIKLCDWDHIDLEVAKSSCLLLLGALPVLGVRFCSDADFCLLDL